MSVILTRDGEIASLTVDRPEALNAVDFETMGELENALAELEVDAQCRVVILTGGGDRSFISGGDLRKFAALTDHEAVAEMATRMGEILFRLERLDAWVIASVNGPAYGGGCETLLACDFRIASDQAKFGFTQGRFAVPPGWGGLTRLIELVGKATALQWLAETRVVDAGAALAAGLVHEVVPHGDLGHSTLAFAQRVARHEKSLIRALKQGARNAHRLPRDEAIARELEPFIECWLGDAHTRSIEAFLGDGSSGETD